MREIETEKEREKDRERKRRGKGEKGRWKKWSEKEAAIETRMGNGSGRT